MDEIDYKAVSADLATQLAEQIYQTAQWKNLAEKLVKDREAAAAANAAQPESTKE